MKKKALKITALVVAIALIVGVLLFADSLIGNPISYALAKSSAERYLSENYEDSDFELERVAYSFKDCYYHAYITSPSSIDGNFTLMINGVGKVCYDNYDYMVKSGWNTANRIESEYREAVRALIESKSFPYDSHMGYGEIAFITEEFKDAPGVESHAVVTDELEPDVFYDYNLFARRAGKITVYLTDSQPSAERLSEILLDIKEIFDTADISFYVIDCILESENPDGERIEVMDFLYSDIYSDGLSERVEASNLAANDYYNSQDK